jgi:hypothetical protein
MTEPENDTRRLADDRFRQAAMSAMVDNGQLQRTSKAAIAVLQRSIE